MTDLRTAAQQALDALNGVLDTYGEPLDKLSIAGGKFEALVCRDAITALRAALAQPEPEWVLSQNELPPPYVAREPIAQPEPAALEDIPACMFCGELIEPAAPTVVEPDVPEAGCGNMEPVAWMTHENDLLPLFHQTKAGALAWGAEPLPLYTAPPQRKPLRTVIYACPICAASLERQE
jgi:hypothetical protein